MKKPLKRRRRRQAKNDPDQVVRKYKLDPAPPTTEPDPHPDDLKRSRVWFPRRGRRKS